MKFIDLFCGMGNFRLGMEMADHECVYSCEWDKHKRRIYEVIYDEEPTGRDIREVSASDIPRADIWCFGAPCQDLSIAGKRAGLKGERSGLFLEVIRLLRETKEENRPTWIIYENVKGLFSSNKGRDFLEVLYQMEQVGYNVEWQLLNTKDFGPPQNRERVYTIGHLRGRGSRKIFPIGGTSTETDIEVVGNLDLPGRYESACRVYGEKRICPALTKCEGGGLQHKVFLNQYRYGKYKESESSETLKVGGDTPLVKAVLTPDRLNKRQNGRRMKEEGEPMFTLTAQDRHGVMIIDDTQEGFNGIRQYEEYAPTLRSERYGLKFVKNTHNQGTLSQSRIRRLTPKECMRLQGVPDYITDKLIAAGISDTQLYRAAGDAVTVNVVYEIAKNLNGEIA